jgi:RimJ/RimL family protein N-acetyltransferase
MLLQPILHTPRLTLRPFELADAPDVQRLAGAREVASTTAAIPHPYADGMAEEWIGARDEALRNDSIVTYALALRENGALVGAMGLHLAREHERAELGYWVGLPYWGQGYCTEAAREVLRYAFEDLRLHRVIARHFRRNPASGRVMQKIGMFCEGTMRQHFIKWGQYEDIVFYAILHDEWLAQHADDGREDA